MNIIEWTFQLRFAVALALGFLVGLERESTKFDQRKHTFGGVRTFPIISMFGFGCAWLYRVGVTFMLPAGLISLGGLLAIAYIAKIKGEQYGSTSEISALLTFIAGALALLVDVWVAMSLGIFNTILLSEKAKLETYVENLNKVEFLATLKFLLVTLIILPVLPDQDYTQFKLNPAHIWEMVILVSSVGFVGYFLSKKFGHRVGLWLSGFLGGIVSSTALTIAAGRMAQKDPEQSNSALQAALLAGSVMYFRILVLIAVINPALIALLWWKLPVLAAIGAGLSLRISRPGAQSDKKEVPGLENPFEITPALWFAAVFVVILIATAVVKRTIGDAGLIGLGAVVGVADIDPFILSLAHESAWQSTELAAIIVAMMSNVVAKGAYFFVLVPSIRKQTFWRYALWAVLHLPLILFL